MFYYFLIGHYMKYQETVVNLNPGEVQEKQGLSAHCNLKQML